MFTSLSSVQVPSPTILSWKPCIEMDHKVMMKDVNRIEQAQITLSGRLLSGDDEPSSSVSLD
jgi:hypothetical protein